MSWNYRIVRYRDGGDYGLHEVYYDDEGEPWGMTERAVGFTSNSGEGPTGITQSLRAASVDARKRPVLDEPKKWPGKAPDAGKNFKLSQISN